MVESIWWVVVEKDKLGHSSVNLRPSLVPSLRYGSCGQRRLPGAVCFQAFLRMSKPASRHDYILILFSYGFKAIGDNFLLLVREEPVRKVVSCLFVWWWIGEGGPTAYGAWTCITVLAQLIITRVIKR